MLRSVNQLVKALTIGTMVWTLTTSNSYADEYELFGVDAEQAYEQGRLLRAQHKITQSLEYLQYAADRGNKKAAFLFAVETIGSKASEREIQQANNYLLFSANSGYRPAMYFYSKHAKWLPAVHRENWAQQYFKTLLVDSKHSPLDVMLEVAKFHKVSRPELYKDYLNTLMKKGVPQAYMEASINRMQNAEFRQLDPNDRQEVMRLMKQAAEQDYIPAIRSYVQMLEANNDYISALEWREKATSLGDLTSLYTMASIYYGRSKNYDFVEPNLAKAKAYFETYIEQAGHEKMSTLYDASQENYSELSAMLTEKQIAKAQEIKESINKSTTFFNHDMYWEI